MLGLPLAASSAPEDAPAAPESEIPGWGALGSARIGEFDVAAREGAPAAPAPAAAAVPSLASPTDPLDAAAVLLEPGAVAGSPGFVASYIQQRVRAAGHLAKLALSTLDEGEAGEPTAQVVGLLLRLCILPLVLHLFRGHFARSLLPVASEFDSMMRDVAAKLWRTSRNWSTPVQLQVYHPLRFGGMGLRPVRELAPAAYLGSWAQVLPDVERLVGGGPCLGPGASATPSNASIAAAEEEWRRLAGLPDTVAVDWAAMHAQRRGLR